MIQQLKSILTESTSATNPLSTYESVLVDIHSAMHNIILQRSSMAILISLYYYISVRVNSSIELLCKEPIISTTHQEEENEDEKRIRKKNPDEKTFSLIFILTISIYLNSSFNSVWNSWTEIPNSYKNILKFNIFYVTSLFVRNYITIYKIQYRKCRWQKIK